MRLFWCVERLNAYKHTCAATHTQCTDGGDGNSIDSTKSVAQRLFLVAAAETATVTASSTTALPHAPRNAHLCMDYVLVSTSTQTVAKDVASKLYRQYRATKIWIGKVTVTASTSSLHQFLRGFLSFFTVSVRNCKQTFKFRYFLEWTRTSIRICYYFIGEINQGMAVIGCIQLCTHDSAEANGDGDETPYCAQHLHLPPKGIGRNGWQTKRIHWIIHPSTHVTSLTHSNIHSVDEEFFFLLSQITFSFYTRKSLPYYNSFRLIYTAARSACVNVNRNCGFITSICKERMRHARDLMDDTKQQT